MRSWTGPSAERAALPDRVYPKAGMRTGPRRTPRHLGRMLGPYIPAPSSARSSRMPRGIQFAYRGNPGTPSGNPGTTPDRHWNHRRVRSGPRPALGYGRGDPRVVEANRPRADRPRLRSAHGAGSDGRPAQGGAACPPGRGGARASRRPCGELSSRIDRLTSRLADSGRGLGPVADPSRRQSVGTPDGPPLELLLEPHHNGRRVRRGLSLPGARFGVAARSNFC
jgi:hypothetical protein